MRGDGVGGRGGVPGRAAGEGGMILVLTLVVLLLLSMLAGASLVNGLLVRSQARSEANAATALHAADAGVAAGMAWLSDPENIDDYPSDPDDVPDPTAVSGAYTNPSWPGWSWSSTLGGSFSWDVNADGDTADPGETGGSYAVTLRFKRERRDRNGDGDCCDTYPEVAVDEASEFRDGDANSCTDCPGDVVLFNAGRGGSDSCPEGPPASGSGEGCFGIPGAHYSGYLTDRGYPVVEIDSVGTYGSSAVREVALFVSRNHRVQVGGVVNSRAEVTISGPGAEIDGRNYNVPGSALDPSCSQIPGVALDPAVPLDCDTDGDGRCTGGECAGLPVIGSSCYETFAGSAPGTRPFQKTPWDVLGMTEADFNAMFTKDAASTTISQPCSSEPYYLWFSKENVHFNNSSGCNSYTGILVVHNEGFDPDLWAANCPDAASMASAYCGDAANQPAVLDTNGNVKWSGIVIADQLMLINGNPVFAGAVFSLASGGYSVATEISGSVSLRASCDAVAEVSRRIGYKKKIGWQRIR